MKENKNEVYFMSMYDLPNGLRKYERFPATRLSPFIKNDLENRGLIRLIPTKAELEREHKRLVALFYGE